MWRFLALVPIFSGFISEKQILGWIGDYGVIVLFLMLAVGIIGLPIPDELIMTTVGACVSNGTFPISLTMVYFSALAGAISGITVSYYLGAKFGQKLVAKHGDKIFLSQERVEYIQNFFDKWGGWVLPFGYFIPGVRHFTACVVGMSSRMSIWRFALFAYLGAAFWCAVFVFGGFFIGPEAIIILRKLHDFLGGDWLFTILALVLVSLVLIFMVRRRRRYTKLRSAQKQDKN
jgi:membrane protein DedA with SNARE-associated domain